MIRQICMRSFARTGVQTAVAAVLAAGFGIAAMAQTPTHTTLTAETREINGRTVATFNASVLDENGSPVTGAVTLVDSSTGRPAGLASAAIDREGRAEIKLDGLTSGDHSIRAVYNGDSNHASSQSETVSVHPQVTVTPDFTLAINPTAITLKQGAAGNIALTVAPVAGTGFTGFISLSCSGTGETTILPEGVTCAFSPANLVVTSPTGATATMSLQTATPGGKLADNRARPFAGPFGNRTGAPVVLAILLPGIVGLGFLGRKRKLYSRLALLTLVGIMTLVGTSACSARYHYLNHGPTFHGTPLGTYNINVTAQTSNGVTATSHTVPLALTVD